MIKIAKAIQNTTAITLKFLNPTFDNCTMAEAIYHITIIKMQMEKGLNKPLGGRIKKKWSQKQF